MTISYRLNKDHHDDHDPDIIINEMLDIFNKPVQIHSLYCGNLQDRYGNNIFSIKLKKWDNDNDDNAMGIIGYDVYLKCHTQSRNMIYGFSGFKLNTNQFISGIVGGSAHPELYNLFTAIEDYMGRPLHEYDTCGVIHDR